MGRKGILSPKRSRFSPKPIRKPIDQAAAATAKCPATNKDGSSPATNIIPSARHPAAASSHKEKKLEPNENNINSSPQPSSPAPITEPTTPSPKAATPTATSASGSKYSKQTPKIGSHNHRYSPEPSPTALHPHVSDQLFQKLSLDGEELADILLNGSRMFKIYKEIASHRQENLSITSYFTKLKALWDELATYSTDLPQCSCGAIEKLSEHTEKEKVMQFLVGLNDSYATICSQILLMSPFPTVEKAYSVIIEEEKSRESAVALETFAAKVIQKFWLLQRQNGHSSNDEDEEYGLAEEIDQNEVRSLPTEPLLTDLGSPVRC